MVCGIAFLGGEVQIPLSQHLSFGLFPNAESEVVRRR
jgi:hypothetical protein